MNAGLGSQSAARRGLSAFGAAAAPVKAAGRFASRAAARVRSIDSPVLTRELRARIRGRRAFLAMFGYVCALGLMATADLLLAPTGAFGRTPVTPATWVTQSQLGELGQRMFLDIARLQLGLVVLMAPALTCGAISSELERRTFEALALTTLPSRTIVLGKLLASLCYLGLLLLCSVPILALSIMLGGVVPFWVALAFFVCLAAALFFGSLGILASALFKRTYAATAAAYALMAFAIIALPLSASHPIPLVIFFGLPVAAVVTAAVRWAFTRRRRGWRPGREVYIGTFGLTYCAIAALLLNEGLLETTTHALTGTMAAVNPVQVIAAPSEVGMLVFSLLALLGTVGAVLGAISVLRALRAPQPDGLEVQARLLREMRSGAVPMEANA